MIKTKQWSVGGSATIEYGGQGDGSIIITSDANNLYEARSMQITIKTTSGSPQKTKTVTISQAARVKINISDAVVTVANQTYSGNAKTPTPTVTLNGTTVPSSGYDVTYSNNTNAGTATVTVTGKGDYTGTASGTFTIAKASRTLSFADSYMVLNTSSNGTKTATPSAGSGDGAIIIALLTLLMQPSIALLVRSIYYGFAVSGGKSDFYDMDSIEKGDSNIIEVTPHNHEDYNSLYIAVPSNMNVTKVVYDQFSTLEMKAPVTTVVDGKSYKFYETAEESGFETGDYLLEITVNE